VPSFLPVLAVCLGRIGNCLGLNLKSVACHAECQVAVIEVRSRVEVQFSLGCVHSRSVRAIDGNHIKSAFQTPSLLETIVETEHLKYQVLTQDRIFLAVDRIVEGNDPMYLALNHFLVRAAS
jgi:hypothetical protein